jgi:FAD/FMN-containing dehydrogenase/Fe-S oxidoreductase
MDTPLVTINQGFSPALEPGYAAALFAELRRAISGEVRFDKGSRGAYSTDASNYRQIPLGVVLPRSVEEAAQVVNICHKYGAPLTSRGGGTSLAGQSCNAAVVLDFSKYVTRVLEIDPDKRLARVEPGVVLDSLREAAAAYGLTFGPDPATHNRCTLGGMLGYNSCGTHSVMAQFYGPGPLTEDNLETLDILTYDGLRLTVGPTSAEELAEIIAAGGRRGQIYADLKALRDRYAEEIRSRYPDIPRRVSGYNLKALLPENGFNVAQALVGTEGSCVTVLGATLKLIPQMPERALVVLGYPDIFQAAESVPAIMAHKPVGLEGFDDQLVSDVRKQGLYPEGAKLLPEGKGWLLVEFGADSQEEAHEQAQQFMESLQKGGPEAKLLEPHQATEIWDIRESGLGATARVPGMAPTHPGWEDAAVDPGQLGDYLREFRRLVKAFGYHAALYGHFGQGCIHCRIDFDFQTAEGVKKFRAFIDRAADLVVAHGGSLSGEHGDGQARAALLPKMYGYDLVHAFSQFKAVWDPLGRMNPGKVVHPYQPEQNLRFAEYHPANSETHFKFPEDGGSFAHAAARCVGVGKCRRLEGGTMCPSYMVTREEEDSTRGRARLLFEMLQGDLVADVWRDKHVKEALDLCLACKGCKSECPVNVDMATYKAEFLSHYYQGRLRPRAAYSMGLIYWWARLASRLPALVNFTSHTPPLSTALKMLGGIALKRKVPPFAAPTFKQWFENRPQHNLEKLGNQPKVILWPDTFSNYLLPDRAKAAVEVLEDAGYQVTLPARPLCCGRPLYDWGMLKQAQRLWKQILETLREDIRAGVPVVGLEPSCVAAFRDELIGLFPHDADAKKLSQQTYMLSEFLDKVDYQPPKLKRKALLHGHCQHKAIMHMDAERALLDKMGLDYDLLDSGCCGMAGSFGFERDKYQVSVRAGERVLLPAVRQAAKDTLIITDGFSCQEQIAQGTDRGALHLAQVIRLAQKESGPAEAYPERRYEVPPKQLPAPVPAALLGLGALALGIWWAGKRAKGRGL